MGLASFTVELMLEFGEVDQVNRGRDSTPWKFSSSVFGPYPTFSILLRLTQDNFTSQGGPDVSDWKKLRGNNRKILSVKIEGESAKGNSEYENQRD